MKLASVFIRPVIIIRRYLNFGDVSLFITLRSGEMIVEGAAKTSARKFKGAKYTDGLIAWIVPLFCSVQSLCPCKGVLRSRLPSGLQWS